MFREGTSATLERRVSLNKTQVFSFFKCDRGERLLRGEQTVDLVKESLDGFSPETAAAAKQATFTDILPSSP